MIRNHFGAYISCLVAMVIVDAATLHAAETIGPQNGTLVIVGGGDREYLVFDHFVELAGGRKAKIVVVPTASSSDVAYDFTANKAARHAREELGMPNVTIVHTHSRVKADSEEFVKPIRNADAVWFSGGRQWRLVDSYIGTRTEKEFRNVLTRGGVIGGSSAGASIQGSFLVRGDTSGSGVLIGDHQVGFGYIKDCAIDQHIVPRKRQRDLIEILTDPDDRMLPYIDRHALLGIGIDEATGIVVRRNEFVVVGKDDGVVLVHDPLSWKRGKNEYLTLRKSAKYDLLNRRVIDLGVVSRIPLKESHASPESVPASEVSK